MASASPVEDVGYYSVGIGDRDMRTDNDDSYASRVPEGEGPVKKYSPEH